MAVRAVRAPVSVAMAAMMRWMRFMGPPLGVDGGQEKSWRRRMTARRRALRAARWRARGARALRAWSARRSRAAARSRSSWRAFMSWWWTYMVGLRVACRVFAGRVARALYMTVGQPG